MANLAKFTIEGTASSPGGYDGTTGQVVHFALEGGPSGPVQRWTVQVYDATDPTSPLASYGAPTLTLVGATSGQKVDAATPGSTITCTLPSGMNSWIVRSLVNGGVNAKGKADSDYVFERMVVVRDGSGRRKVLATEATQYGPEGWARAVNDHLAAIPSSIAAGTEAGQHNTWNGSIYVPMRFAVIPNYDLTGAVSAVAAINAAASRVGAWVHLPDGIALLDNTITPAAGVTITGPERGMRRGHRVDVPITNAGVLLKATNTAVPLFQSSDECSFRNLEIYYPNQNPNGVTPTAYGATFNITSFGVTVENITAINPYTLMNITVAGCKVDTIYAFPLFRGIVLGVCNDVVRVSNVHLNPNLSDANATFRALGPNLKTYAAANAIAYVIDGAEGFQFSECFAFGYTRGLHLGGGSGYFAGGGFDQCATDVMLAGAGGSGASTLSGIVFTKTGFVTPQGGIHVNFADTHVAATASERPRIELVACVFDASGTGSGRGIYMPSTSYGVCQITGGLFQHQAAECGFNDSANGWLRASGVASTPTCAARFHGGSPNIFDDGGMQLP